MYNRLKTRIQDLFDTFTWNNAYYKLCFISLAVFECLSLFKFQNVCKNKKRLKYIYIKKMNLSVVLYLHKLFPPNSWYTLKANIGIWYQSLHFDGCGIHITCFALCSQETPLTTIHAGPIDVMTGLLSKAHATWFCTVLSICPILAFCYQN